MIQAPSENCNFEVANIEATKRTKYLENILLISNRKISFLNIDFKLMLEKFLQKLKTNFSKEVNLPIYLTYCLYDNFSQDFLCYEIFVKTHYTNYLEIFQNFWNSNKEENRLDILFYLDIYRRTDNKGHIIKMIEDYMSLRNVEVYKCILNYIFKEQSPNAFDKFWIISLLFYSFYFHYFTISFTDFLKNMLELKV